LTKLSTVDYVEAPALHDHMITGTLVGVALRGWSC